MYRLRRFLWRLLGIDYRQALRIHDYVFLRNDKFTHIGHKTYDNGAMVWRWTDAELTIGKYCSIANNVRFIIDDGYHQSSPDAVTSFPVVNNLFKNETSLPSGIDKNQFLNELKQRKGITIGNDVWIGMGAFIMPGVTVGNGVIIAANSVVTKDIPDYRTVAGAPAKVVKQKLDEDKIQIMNKIAWWDWDEKLIKQRAEDFYLKIDDFIKKYDNQG